MKRLDGKAAIITGATGGLGTAVTSVFLSEGAQVTANYRKDGDLEDVKGLIEEYGASLNMYKANVLDRDEVAAMAEDTAGRFGSIDILVNIVGGFAQAGIEETDEELLDRMISLNLKSAFLNAKTVAPHMIKRKYGRIINIGARPAIKGAAGMLAYGASKAGVLNMTESLAAELKADGVNVNMIIPGTMNTPGNRASMPDADHSEWVEPEEIARVIVFLCSEEAKDISGAVVPVYGQT